jgi:hypothetical protein
MFCNRKSTFTLNFYILPVLTYFVTLECLNFVRLWILQSKSNGLGKKKDFLNRLIDTAIANKYLKEALSNAMNITI